MILHIHKYQEVKTQTAKNICFGDGCVPIIRQVLKCTKCNKIKYRALTVGTNPTDKTITWI